MGKNVLVTGATGLLGSHLAHKLASNGYIVSATFRNEASKEITRRIFGYYSENNPDLFNSLKWVKCDVEDRDQTFNAVKGMETVYHCAAKVSFDGASKSEMVRSNIQVTRNVAEACLAQKGTRLCHVSSTAAIGAAKSEKYVSEASQWCSDEIHSPYAESKHLSELEIFRAIDDGLDAVIVNPSVIIGPGDWKRSSAQFFPAIDRGMLFYTDGVTGYVGVEDVVNLMILLAESTKRGERYLVTSENLSIKEIFTLIAGSLGRRKPLIYVPEILAKGGLAVASAVTSLTGRKSLPVKDAVGSAYSKVFFDNSKVVKATGYKFRPVEEAVMFAGSVYRREKG
jgi:nucleoside-diphosphate-sugar epimerase